MPLQATAGPDPLPAFNLMSPLKMSVSRWSYVAVRCLLHLERDEEVGRLLRLTPDQVKQLRDMELIEEP